ncbi:MAG TPA: 3-dehydroquinate synthase [Sphingobacteriaceae bacterium]|nr:3-dehydroquinate synthase [Sphingobacteriaceae bacterium]
MEHLSQSFTIKYDYQVYFTTSLFSIENTLFNDFLTSSESGLGGRKILYIVDKGVVSVYPQLIESIRAYFNKYKSVQLISDILIIPGGEGAKNDETGFKQILEAVHTNGIDRHSYIAAIGGGSILDMVGYASAVAHRGIKHIRIPTTVLSQNDSGVGVKNGINYFNKKNFLGTFSPPVAVFNDDLFLNGLTDAEWRSGISEAVKVALIKDNGFFQWLEENSTQLVDRDRVAMNYLIWKCAKLHMEHIASSDPFESGSSRPLDFGHWSAHKLEYLTNFQIRHGEAVAMGIALDTVYSNLAGLLPHDETQRILQLLMKFGFEVTHPLLQIEEDNNAILTGLEEFREHLGGILTIMLITAIGQGVEVHEMDRGLLKEAGKILNNFQP